MEANHSYKGVRGIVIEMQLEAVFYLVSKAKQCILSCNEEFIKGLRRTRCLELVKHAYKTKSLFTIS